MKKGSEKMSTVTKVFTDIECILPEWKDAREVISKKIPYQLTFTPNYSVIGINCDWLEDIVSECPEDHKDIVSFFVSQALEVSAGHIDLERFNRFIRAKVTDSTMSAINEEVEYQDRERLDRGEPSFIQILKHLLGIKRCFLIG